MHNAVVVVCAIEMCHFTGGVFHKIACGPRKDIIPMNFNVIIAVITYKLQKSMKDMNSKKENNDTNGEFFIYLNACDRIPGLLNIKQNMKIIITKFRKRL